MTIRTDLRHGDYGYIDVGARDWRVFLLVAGEMTAYTLDGLVCTVGPIRDSRYTKVGNLFDGFTLRQAAELAEALED